nr:DUF2207 domain-containing protein [Lysinibacter cavernae]
MSLDDITGSSTTATEHWIARDFNVDYRIDRNNNGELRATVTEHITAFFTEKSNETGITRVLATQYEGHALNPRLLTATLDGVTVQPAETVSGNQLALSVDTGTRLQGDHEFVMTYELSNLAYSATDTASEQAVDLLKWDVFGPSWAQALAGLDVSITVPKELDDRLIRQPRGSLAWTIVGAGQWLEREPGSGSDVTYQFTNDQNIPPHAQASFTMSFEEGTFTMPPPTLTYWIQVFGPLAPLAFLALTLLFALAARAVAWSDARGRPWYIVQYDPPKGVSPQTAAYILRTPQTVELAEALEFARTDGKKTRKASLREAAKVARRTGRAGNLPRALTHYYSSPERRGQLTKGYRKVPRGFVRDFFIAAPIALTIVQFGLIRQLSNQVVLSVIWWPFAFVLVSSFLAAVVLWVALSARPLTRKGALVKQHLLGIEAFSERTQLLQRTETSNKLLPYAVHAGNAKDAGQRVATLIEHELGPDATAGWRTREFLSWPRILVRVLSPLLIIGALAAAVALPTPYPQSVDYESYWGDIPGTLWTKVEAIEASATLSRTPEGSARLEVNQQLEVNFSDESSQTPQFAQQWPDSANGQDLGLEVTAVRIDGKDVPFAVERDHDTKLVRTKLVEVLTGTHTLDIDYALNAAAFAADENGLVDRVRWAALLDGWEHTTGWGDDPAPKPVRISFTLDDTLAALATESGWITKDTESSERAREWKATVIPFGELKELGARAAAASESSSASAGAHTHVLLIEQDEFGGWPLDPTLDDVGAMLDFPAGTFTQPDEGTLRFTQFVQTLPVLAIGLLSAIAILCLPAAALIGRTTGLRLSEQGLHRDLLRWLAPCASVAAFVLFVWASSVMPSDHPLLPLVGFPPVIAILVSVIGLVVARPRKQHRIPAKP